MHLSMKLHLIERHYPIPLKAKLLRALRKVEEKISGFRKEKKDWADLIEKAFGSYSEIKLANINVVLLDVVSIKGLRGAYYKGTTTKEECIFLNLEWLTEAEEEELEAVLLEEIGHTIDQRINQGDDSEGDEGAVFSSLIRGMEIPFEELAEDDQRTIYVNGSLIKVEASASNLDDDGNGLVDGVNAYQLFDSGSAIDLHIGDSRALSDLSSANWNVTKAVKVDEEFKILLTGNNNQEGRFIVWTANSDGLRTSSTGWRVGSWLKENGYESVFNVNFGDALLGGIDSNADGLVDSVNNYRLFDSEVIVDLHLANGKPLSDSTTNKWDVTSAGKDGDSFKALLAGRNQDHGKYIIWTTDSNGLKTHSTGWKVGNWLEENGHTTLLGNVKTSIDGQTDLNADGLADIDNHYLLYEEGVSVFLHKSNGNTISNSSSPVWNVTKAVKVGDEFKVLLTGVGNEAGKFIVWTTNEKGLVTNSTGWKVGNWLQLNAYDVLFGLDFSGSDLIELPSLQGQIEGDRFGNMVAISSNGDRLAVSSPHNDTHANNAGKISIYNWNNLLSQWETLGNPIYGEASNDMAGVYGLALSNDGNRVAVGSPWNNAKGTRTGQTQIFDWDGSEWAQAGSDINGERKQDYFGYAVDLSGDGNILAVGAKMNDNSNGYNSGHVRVFNWSNSEWSQIGDDIDGEDGSDYSGTAVSLSDDGSILAVGAFHNDGGSPGAARGHVRVYKYNGSQWVQLGGDINGEATYDLSGSYIDLTSNGTRLAIGALGNDGVNGEDSGHVRVYEWDSTNWVQLGNDIDGAAADDYFGRSPKFFDDGNKIIIGSRNNAGNGENSGHAKLFKWSGSDWIEFSEIIVGDNAGDFLGGSIAVSSDGGRISVGAPGNNEGYTKNYKLIPLYPYEVNDIDNDGLVDNTNNYQLFDSGSLVHLHKDSGTPISSASSSKWNVANAAKSGEGFQVLLKGRNDREHQYIVWSTDSNGLKTSSTGWKVGNWMRTNGYESVFSIEFNDSIVGVSDADSDGFVDGEESYQLIDGDAAVYLHDSSGKVLSDSSSSKWNATKAVKIGNQFRVLMTGLDKNIGRYMVWTTDKYGFKIDSTGMKIGNWMDVNGYGTMFNMNLRNSLSDATDFDRNGLVDGSVDYQLFNNENSVYLQNSSGGTFSDSTSGSWTVTKASKIGDQFKVLVTGVGSSAGKYIVWSADLEGVRVHSTGWRVGRWMNDNDYDETFGTDFTDPITGAVDSNADGLVDNVIDYQLVDGNKSYYLNNSNGRTITDATSNSWNVTKSVKVDDAFKVLLTGLNSHAGNFAVWTTSSIGTFSTSTGFKDALWMTANSYESIFNIDFNSNSIID